VLQIHSGDQSEGGEAVGCPLQKTKYPLHSHAGALECGSASTVKTKFSLPLHEDPAATRTPNMVALTRALAERAISAGRPLPEFLRIAMFERGELPEFVRRWQALLGFPEDYPLGVTLCVEGQVFTTSPQVYGPDSRSAAQPNEQFITFPPGTVGSTLSELLAYARLIKNLEHLPFKSDCGKFADEQLSLTRHQSNAEMSYIYRRMVDSAQEMLEVIIESYAECLRVAMRQEIRERVNGIDFDHDYLKVVADQLRWDVRQRAKYLELNQGPKIDSFWIDFVGGKMLLTEERQAEFLSLEPRQYLRGFCLELIVNRQHLSRLQKVEALHLRNTLDRANFTDANCIELAISGSFPAQEYTALRSEYSQANSDRKWEIFGLFSARGWGKPF
jgi:hypothetical protein